MLFIYVHAACVLLWLCLKGYYIYIYQVSVICRFNSLVRQMFVQEQQGVLTRLQF